MLGNVDGTVERAVGVVVGALVVLEIEEVQIDVELAGVHQLDERRVKLAVHRGAAGAQRLHVDGDGRSVIDFLRVALVGDKEAGLVAGFGGLGLDFVDFAVRLVHSHAGLFARVCRVHSLVYGESSDGHQHHDDGHNDATNKSLLLTLFGGLRGLDLQSRFFGCTAFGASGTFGLTL